jgi:hypothetical protein
MPLLASAAIAAARERWVEFSEVEFLEDAETLAELHTADVYLLDRILQVQNPLYPLDDLCAEGAIDGVRGPWPLPADFWRARYLETEYLDGVRRRIHTIPASHARGIPALVPAGYIMRRTFHPVDGLYDSPTAALAGRRWGWEDCKTLHVKYVARPAELASAASPLGCPPDALRYFARRLAVFMAVRAKAEDIPVRLFKAEVESAEAALLETVASYGRTDA